MRVRTASLWAIQHASSLYGRDQAAGDSDGGDGFASEPCTSSIVSASEKRTLN